MFLWSAPWLKGWVNNREAGDLRRHRAYYDVTVMGEENVYFASVKSGQFIRTVFENSCIGYIGYSMIIANQRETK